MQRAKKFQRIELNFIQIKTIRNLRDAVFRKKLSHCKKIMASETLTNVNMKFGAFGDTCLIAAVRRNHTEICKLLLSDKRFDIHTKNGGGKTAVQCAYANSHIKCFILLVEHGADCTNVSSWKFEELVYYSNSTTEQQILMTEIAKKWKYLLPLYTRKTHKLYPKSFKKKIVGYLWIFKQLNETENTNICKDIQIMLIQWFTVNWRNE